MLEMVIEILAVAAKLMLVGAGGCLSWVGLAFAYDRWTQHRLRCAICRVPDDERMPTRYGMVCPKCRAMLLRRSLGMRARG